jgi:hypothetical protein
LDLSITVEVAPVADGSDSVVGEAVHVDVGYVSTGGEAVL